MRAKFLVTLLICVLSSPLWAAVDAESVEILRKTSDTYKNSTGTELEIKISLDDAQSGTTNSTTGTLKTKGKKFALTTGIAVMHFDGQALFIFDKGANEITITAPLPSEVQDLDPTSIMTAYETGFQITAPEKTKEGNKTYATISLFPEDKKEDYFKTSIKVDLNDYKPVQIKTYGKNGMVNTIDVLKIKTNQDFTEKDLEFNFKKHKDAQIIDIR